MCTKNHMPNFLECACESRAVDDIVPAVPRVQFVKGNEKPVHD